MAEATVSSPEFVLSVDACITDQAWTTYRTYKDFVEVEDLKQEGLLWALERPDRVAGYQNHEKPKLAYWWLSRDLWEVMDRYARKERAQRLGYEPDDEAFYGKAVLEALLPAVLIGNPIQPQGEPQEGKSNRDPAEGGTFLAMYLDVEKAWKTANLTTKERETLQLVFGEQWTHQEVAEEFDVGRTAVTNMIKRALDKMVNKIGGQYPPRSE